MRYRIGAENEMAPVSLPYAITAEDLQAAQTITEGEARQTNKELRGRQETALRVFLPTIAGLGIGILLKQAAIGGALGAVGGFAYEYIRWSKVVEPTTM